MESLHCGRDMIGVEIGYFNSSNMKTLKITLVILFLSFIFEAVNGQYEKGNIFFSGSSKMGFSTFKSPSDEIKNTSSFEISPQIGAFFSEGFVIGADLQFSLTKKIDVMDQKISSNSFGFAPFLRKYIGTSRSRAFFQGEAGLGSLVEKGVNENYSYWMYLFELDAGIDIYLNKIVSLDLFAGYAYSKFNPTKDNYRSSFTISGFSTGVGFVISF
jgi:hypothetical protein